MNYKYCVMSLVLGITGLFMNNATADCLSSIMPQKDGILTWSDLAKYDHCLKAEKTTPNRPLTLSQDTWAAACSGGSFTANKCFADTTGTVPNETVSLVLRVTNLYAIANVSLTADYPAGSIWIGRFPPGSYSATNTSNVPNAGAGNQAFCGVFTEVGWNVPGDGIYTSDIGSQMSEGGLIQATSSEGGGAGSSFPMSNSELGLPLKNPLYIICLGRNFASFAPAALPADFAVTWS